MTEDHPSSARGEQAIRRSGAIRVARLSKELVGYFGVSLAALAVDAALLFGLTETGHVGYLTASAVSYTCGAVLHYLLSVRFVFAERRLAGRRAEFVVYTLVGAFGLLITQVVLKVSVDFFGMNYMFGKAAAVGLSFVTNYALRRALLFTLFRTVPVAA